MRSHRLILIFVLSVAVPASTPLLAQTTPAAHDIADALESDRWQRLVLDGETIHNAETLGGFYQQRDFAPVWFERLKVERLLAALGTAESNGLRRTDYHFAWLSKWARAASERPLNLNEAADLDLIASDAFLLYGSISDEAKSGRNTSLAGTSTVPTSTFRPDSNAQQPPIPSKHLMAFCLGIPVICDCGRPWSGIVPLPRPAVGLRSPMDRSSRRGCTATA